MKNRFWNSKKEDVSTNNILAEDRTIDEVSGDRLTELELDFIVDAYQKIEACRPIPETSQTDALGQRIVRSIDSSKRRELLVRYSSAAVLLLLVGLSVFFNLNKEPEIRTFAANQSLTPLTGNTRLILSGQEEIQIDSKESKIEYKENGNAIEIDASHQVVQAVNGDAMPLNTVIVPYGKRTQLTLSDNSKIWLNSGSKLIYPAQFVAQKREVYLEGEAIFEVSHDKEHPFHVITRNMEVKVLGTVFNVSAYNDDCTTKTILESGSVELKYNDNSFLSQSKVTMVPGSLAVYNPAKGTMEQTQVNTKLYTSWREGFFVLEKQTLGSILKKISRYYNVSIQLNDQELANETFSGNLDLRNSAIEVLEGIAMIVDFEIESIDNQILIKRM